MTTAEMDAVVRRAGDVLGTLRHGIEQLDREGVTHADRVGFVDNARESLGWLSEYAVRMSAYAPRPVAERLQGVSNVLALLLAEFFEALESGEEKYFADLLRFELYPAVTDLLATNLYLHRRIELQAS